MFKKLNILKLFFEKPTKEFNVRETARILKISPATASKELKKLAKKRIIKERKERIYNFYRAAIGNGIYRDWKTFYNIRKIKEMGLIDALNKFYLNPTIVLFGSTSYGMDTETSDYDLLIISEKIKDFPEKQKFEKKLHRKLQIFQVKTIKDMKNKHLINNILNGITIQGAVEWT